MRVILAPMEGLVDAPIRETLTKVGGIDRCVTEFVRVTHGMLLPVFSTSTHRNFTTSR